MSSDFYSSSLSRNLVSTGGLGYRENVSLLYVPGGSDSAGAFERGTRATTNFLAMSAGRDAVTEPLSDFRSLAISVGRHPFVGPLPL